jgi:hypothetical protein
MGEYQYYDFRAVDRPVAPEDRAALRELSSQARITATRFTNHYDWGDFKGDPKALMERCFDLHLYYADWGARRLMLRVPKRLVPAASIEAVAGEVEGFGVWIRDDNLVLDIFREEVERYADDGDEDAELLAELAPLRDDLISGDLRLLYLVWLMAVETGEVDDDAVAPLAALGPLTGAHDAFADFFGIDGALVEAAAEDSAGGADEVVASAATRDAVTALPEHEKASLLLRIAEGDPRVAAELRASVRAQGAVPATPAPTAGELRTRAAAIHATRERTAAERLEAERRRREAVAEVERQARLDDLKRRDLGAVWRQIETEIQRRAPRSYDRAASLISDLGAIAAEDGTLSDFVQRLAAVRDRHAGKRRFIERLDGLPARPG